ncbi:MAG TPA: ATP-grasp domain-containing protein [Blastocatellia bacterium]|jgi:biotin carboxylase|nr:ATP-grasp domain-containing protein [Blastocatellia bacterium]
MACQRSADCFSHGERSLSGNQINIVCIASYFKGEAFLRECRRQGCRVFLVTVESLRDADWPRESIDEIFYMPDKYSREDILKGISYLARTEVIDRIVPLDEFDQETAAQLREHLRIPGMGDTTARYFRDKLAMRMKAKEAGILVPEFVHVLNYDRLRKYMAQVPPPWVLKPRSEAASIGIKKLTHSDELWPLLDRFGDRQSFYVLEQYIPGDIYHVDSIISEREIVFAVVSKYGRPPMDVSLGGVFTTRKIPHESADAQSLELLNRDVIKTLGLVRGVTHTEFIKGRDDGRFYFLETAARVGGANIAECIEAATGINLWAEWARIEVYGSERAYELPPHRDDYAGVVISLARQECPDTSAYDDPEIVYRLNKKHHAGVVLASPSLKRVEQLLDEYSRRFYEDFYTTEPPPASSSDL